MQSQEEEIQTLVLDQVRCFAESRISPEILADLEVRAVTDFTSRQMLVRLETEILSDNLGRVTFSRPATAWDHWKQEQLPRLGRIGRWYLRRHPVREHFEVRSASAMFPRAGVRIPKNLGSPTFKMAVMPDMAD